MKMIDKKSEENEKNSFDVLEFFGLKLKVSNKKLADLLTMDAKEAFTEDIRVLKKKYINGESEKLAQEGELVKNREEIIDQDEYLENVVAIGELIGFDIQMGGIWKSPTGVCIITKPLLKINNLEKAKHLIEEVWKSHTRLKNENTGLFIVGDQIGCDIIKASIRAEGYYGSMRVISYENMVELLRLFDQGYVGHREIATLLIPLDNVDVGELINIVKAAASPSSLEEFLKRKD